MTTFYAMTDSKFSIQAIAPSDAVQALAICKAVWFAEKKHVEQIALSNPVYGPPKQFGPAPAKIPDGWSVLNATVYLNAHSPDGNPTFSVSDKVGSCRQTWDWYR